MSSSNYIVDVSEADFEYEVIQFSLNTPVVVDFWAEWCNPCKTLGPILSRLAEEARGAFRLAKVDVDASPNLSKRYGVRSIPTVKSFSGGQMTGEFVGLIPEPRIREFLAKLIPGPTGLALEKGQGLLAQHQWPAAQAQFSEVLAEVPDQPAALLGLAMCQVVQGQGQAALRILRGFPASKEFTSAEKLLPLAEAVSAFELGQLGDDTSLDAAYRNAIRLATRGNLYAALDGLLDILREEKRYRGGAARTAFLGLLEILGDDDPQTRQYRIDLSAVLF